MTTPASALAMLKAVRAKIIEANPDILLSTNHPIQNAIARLMMTHDVSGMSLREIGGLVGIPDAHPQQIKHHLQTVKARRKRETVCRPIRLADVLIALKEMERKHGGTGWCIARDALFEKWNLHGDLDLVSQSKKCLTFLHSLLCK